MPITARLPAFRHAGVFSLIAAIIVMACFAATLIRYHVADTVLHVEMFIACYHAVYAFPLLMPAACQDA